MRIRAASIIFLWALPLAAAAQAPSAVLDANRAASDGQAWAGHDAIELDYDYEGQGLTGKVVALIDLKRGRYVLNEHVGPVTQIEGYDGAQAWTRDPSGAVTAQNGGDAAQLAVNQGYRFANLWWRPDLAGAAVVGDGTKSDAGGDFDVLTVTPKGGKPFDAWFDAKTHLLARVIEVQGPDTVTTTYADYRDIAGVKLPFQVVTGRGDPKYDDHTQLTGAAFKPEPADAAFAPPQAGAADHGFVGGATETTIPFRLLNNHVYATVNVDGKPFTFLFDTGGQNLITPQTAKALGLKAEGNFQGGGAGENHVDFGLTKVEDFRIGQAFLHDIVFPVVSLDALDDAEGAQVDGLVGFETYRRFVTRFDYGAGTVTFIDPKAFKSADAGVAIPFKVDGTNVLIPMKYNGQEGGFILDTGSRGPVTLSTAFAKAHGADPDRVAGVRAMTGWGFGGASRGVVTRGRIEIGSFILDRAVVWVSTDKGGTYADAAIAGNVGGAILKRFVVTLDYDHSTLYLKPIGRRVADLDTSDRAGVWLNRSADGYRVLDVVAGSPADQAGLKVGDEVTAIDGQPAKTLSLDVVRLKLRTLPPGTVVTFTVRRDGQTKRLEVTLRDLV
jgi:hypothetical protein